ncbi:hypothetical protein GGR57DRAFT_519615 [Xylariaceae sp. FL1272]|nr:hypothetical protein GGR57DRAFT_519615 [Xylariaceae sp. FL1272]
MPSYQHKPSESSAVDGLTACFHATSLSDGSPVTCTLTVSTPDKLAAPAITQATPIGIPYELRLMIFNELCSSADVKALAAAHPLFKIVNHNRQIWAAVGRNVTCKHSKFEFGHECVELGALCLAALEVGLPSGGVSEHKTEMARMCDVFRSGSFTDKDVGRLERQGPGVLCRFNQLVYVLGDFKRRLCESLPQHEKCWTRPLGVDDVKLYMITNIFTADFISWVYTNRQTDLYTEPLLAPYDEKVQEDIMKHAIKMNRVYRNHPFSFCEVKHHAFFHRRLVDLGGKKSLQKIFEAHWLSLGEWSDFGRQEGIKDWPEQPFELDEDRRQYNELCRVAEQWRDQCRRGQLLGQTVQDQVRRAWRGMLEDRRWS